MDKQNNSVGFLCVNCKNDKNHLGFFHNIRRFPVQFFNPGLFPHVLVNEGQLCYVIKKEKRTDIFQHFR